MTRKGERRTVLCLVLTTTLVTGPAALVVGASREPVRGEQGIVVSVSPIASEVGVEMLKKGGNAIDAAVAVGFALAVTWPEAGNLGSDGFLIFHEARTAKNVAIDYRATAPGRAHRDMFLDNQGEVLTELSRYGHMSAGVPGMVAGLLLALEQFGTLDRATVLAPAIRLAEEGFPVDRNLANSLKRAAGLLSRFPESKRIFLRDGRYYEEGETFVQGDLAAVLRLVAEEGAKGFYEGKVAHLLEEEMMRGGGVITEEDLKRYSPVVREPVQGTYRGNTVLSMPPPSSGGTVLIEMLNMVEPVDLAAFGHNSSAYVHLLAEVMKRAYADRAEFMADSDFSPVPVRGLTSKDYAQKRRANIDPYRTTPSAEIGAGNPQPFESEDTTHFSIVDKYGNAVSNTYTLKSLYGSGVTVKGAGFLMNNEMDNFTVKVGVPNAFGLIQSEANVIAPGKRPLSSMSPTIVLKEGNVLLVAGTPGGSTIINTVFQVVLNIIDHGMNAQEAVDAPRFHHQWLPDVLSFEKGGLVLDVQEALIAKGHEIHERGLDAGERPFIGDAQVVYVEQGTGLKLGGADPRRGGKAVGY